MNSRIIALIVLLVFCGFVFSETLEGEFGVTVRMQVDTENRLVVKTSREYHVLTDDGRMIPVQGRHSDLKKIPLTSTVILERKNHTSDTIEPHQFEESGEVKEWRPSVKRQASYAMDSRYIGVGEINVLWFAVNLVGATWSSQPDPKPMFDKLRNHFLRNSYGQLSLVSKKRDGSFGYYGIYNTAVSATGCASALAPISASVQTQFNDDVWWNGDGGKVIRILLWTPAMTTICKSAWGTVGHPGNVWSEMTDYFLSHEVGHVVGSFHAGHASNPDSYVQEYGDCSDPMGCLGAEVPIDLIDGGGHMNAPHKVLVGWMRDQPSRIKTLDTPTSGRFNLVPLSWADNGGQLQVLMLGKSSVYTDLFRGLGSLFISYRWIDSRPGFEDNFKEKYQGISIHQQIDATTGRSYLLGVVSAPGQVLEFLLTDMNVRITAVAITPLGGQFDLQYVLPANDNPGGGVHIISAPLQFFTIPPYRLIDTREPGGGGRFFAGEARTYNLYATPNVPSTAVSFAGGISAVDGGAGYLTLYPASAVRPLASSINFQPGLLIMGSTYTGVAKDGTFRIFANVPAQVILDITGYFAPATGNGLWFNPVTPFRAFDTRLSGGKIRDERALPFRGVGAIANSAMAVSISSAMVNSDAPGFMTVWADGAKPWVSAGLYNPGITSETAGISSIGSDGNIRFFAHTPIDIITDVDGFFDPNGGLGFVPTATPARLLDTRETAYHGAGDYVLKVAGAPPGPTGVTIPAAAKVLVCTVAAISAGVPGYVTIYPSGGARPLAAQLQLNPGQSVMALALNIPLGPDGSLTIYMQSPGDLVIDATGYYIDRNAPLATENTLVGLYSLFPTLNAGYYLGSIDAVLPFRALAGPRSVSSVEVRLNGQRIGDAHQCENNGWCFEVNFHGIDGPALVEAVPSDGPSISYRVPLLRPMWMAPYLNQLNIQSPAIYGGSFKMNWLAQSGTASFDIPLLGLKHSWKTQLDATVNFNQAGIFYLTGTGSRIDTFTTLSATRSGNFDTKFTAVVGVDEQADKVRVPVVRSASVTYNGELPLPSLWKFSEDVSLFGFQFHVQVNVDAKASAALTLKYGPSASPSDLFFGLPVVQTNASGDPLKLGTTIAGRVDAGPISAGFAANLSLTPQVSWTQAKGLEWTGMQTSANMAVNLDLWHLRAHLVMANTNGLIAPKRNINALANAVTEPLVSTSSPKLTSISPFILENVYSSAMTGVASANGVDVMVWSSFDSARTYPSNLQVQFSFRRAGGNWSEPSFVPGTPLHPIGTPVLEDIEPTGDIVLVVSEVLNPEETSLAKLQTRLLYSLFRGNAWTSFAPMFTEATQPVTDWLPQFSETGLWMSFVRYDHTAHTGQLLVARYSPTTGWTAPEVVLADSSVVSGFSLDTDLSGNAILVFRSALSSKINMCLRSASTTLWTCGESAWFPAADASSLPSVLFTGHRFLIVWSSGMAVHTAMLSLAGEVIAVHSNETASEVQGVVASVCKALGDGSAAIGWNNWTPQGAQFQYAAVDVDGAMYFSEATLAKQIVPQTYSSSAQLAWTGSKLLYMTISRSTETDGSATGVLSAQDLSFEAVASLSAVQFSPYDFSAPVVNSTLTLTNLGLKALAAGGRVVLRLITPADDNFLVGSFVHTSEILSGRTVDVLVAWTIDMNIGGTVEAIYVGSSGAVAERVVCADPCYLTLGSAAITDAPDTSGEKSAISVILTVYGPAAGDVILSAWTCTADNVAVEVGAWQHHMQPNYRQTVLIPIRDETIYIDDLQIRAKGVTAKASLLTTAHDERYDFSLRMEDINVQPGMVMTSAEGITSGSFLASFPVSNSGSLGATINAHANLIDSKGNKSPLASKQLAIGATSHVAVNLSFVLTNKDNLVEFSVNSEEQPLPELNTENNFAKMQLVFAGATSATSTPTPSASWSEPSATPVATLTFTPLPPSSSSSNSVRKTGKGFIGGHMWAFATIIVLAVLVLVGIVLVLAYLVVMNVSKKQPSRKVADDVFSSQYTSMTN